MLFTSMFFSTTAKSALVTFTGAGSADLTARSGGAVLPFNSVDFSFSFDYDDQMPGTVFALGFDTFVFTAGSNVFSPSGVLGFFEFNPNGFFAVGFGGAAGGIGGLDSTVDDFVFNYQQSFDALGAIDIFTSLVYAPANSGSVFDGVNMNFDFSMAPAAPTAVPLPAALPLYGMGIILLSRLRRRRQRY